MAKWLFEVGAAENIRIEDTEGTTPMFVAFANGHRHAVKWLFEAGAAEDIRIPSNFECAPLYFAHVNQSHSTLLLLVLQGAANDESGNVDAAIFERDTPAGYKAARKDLCQKHFCPLRPALGFHSLRAPCDPHCPRGFCRKHVSCSTKLFALQGLSPLVLLCDHEEILLTPIADFVEAARGLLLRNARLAAVLIIE
jgi:hypothetical protein